MIKTDNAHLVLFPQLLGVYKFDKKEELKKEIKSQIGIYKGTEYEQKHDAQGIVHYFNSSDQSFFDDQPETIDIIEDLRAFIIRKTNAFADELGYNHPGFFISDAWINVANKNTFQAPHNHVNSFISGTYYVEYNPEKHSALEFKNPSSYHNYPFMDLEKIDRENHVCGDTYKCHWLEEGMLVLWQSGLYHKYPRNIGDNRISISFNLFPRTLKKGDYGVDFT